MRVRSSSIVLLLAAVALAGCADGTAPPVEADPALDDLDLKASDSTGIIRGIVVDPSIVPVVGATITIQSTGASTTTNENGAFGFSNLDPGSYFLTAEKLGYTTVQSSVDVRAGVDEPPVLKLLLEQVPGAAPFIQDLYFKGFLTCGAAVFATSVGCTTLAQVAEVIGDQSIFPVEYDRVPQWIQGELLWEATQPAAGAFIWEITAQGSNTHLGYRETTTSPALAYMNTTVIEEEAGTIMDPGLNFRFFGGPHELCQIPVARPPGTPVGWGFGCGLTVEQEAEVFVHNFYNFAPDEGWRFTADGAHPVPA